MRMTFSTFVTPARDSDTRTAGADACTSGIRESGVGSIDSGAYRGLSGASRRLASALWDPFDLVLFGELSCPSFAASCSANRGWCPHDREEGPLGGGRHAVRADGLLR